MRRGSIITTVLSCALAVGLAVWCVMRDPHEPSREDERHLLYEAAWNGGDGPLRDRIMAEIGLVRDGETWFLAQSGPEALRFAREHADWLRTHAEESRPVNDRAAALAYIRSHSHCCPQ